MLNQYGEDITTSSLPNLSYSTSKGSVSVNKNTLTLTADTAFKADDKVVLTVIDQTATVTANSTITVVSQAKVSSVTFAASSGIYTL